MKFVDKIREDVPDGWRIVQLEEILERITNGTTEKQVTEPPGLPVTRIETISHGVINLEKVKYLRDLDDEKRKKFTLHEGDILFSHINSDLHLGKTAVVQKEKDLIHGMNLMLLRFDKDAACSKYIHYLFNLLRIKGEFISIAQHAVNQSSLNQGKIKALEIPLAPPEQQKRIVAKIEELFSHIDAGIEALKKAKQLLKQYRQSVLKVAVTGELTKEWREANKGNLEPVSKLLERILKERRGKWEEKQLDQFKAKGKIPKDGKWKVKYLEPVDYKGGGYEIPETWVMARAEQLCEFITKGTTPKKDKLSAGKGEVPFIKVYNITFDTSLNFNKDPTFTDKETHEGFLARSKVFPDDVLMNIVGPPLGKVSIVPETHNEWNINQAIAVYRPITGLSNKLLAYFLLSKPVVEWMLRKTKTTAGQVNLTLEISRNTPIPIMPIEEQREIVRLVEEKLISSDRLLEELGKQQIKAEKNKQSILASVFSGKILEPYEQPEYQEKIMTSTEA